ITEILTDGARNVIPSTVTIRGDCRGFTEHVQDKIETRMRTIVQGIALAHDAIATVNYSHEFVVLNNTPTETKAAVSAALAIVGSNALDADCPPAPCSEDFARMLAVKPGCYILIGNDDDSHTQPLHNPSYDFNDKITSTGIDYWIELVEQQLSSNPESQGNLATKKDQQQGDPQKQSCRTRLFYPATGECRLDVRGVANAHS
ncbi:MAG: M20/M25/M40 family metallo-hydrolase, partial [Acidimicrobiales bacterium]